MEPGEAFAWILVLLSYALPLCIREITRSRSLRRSVWAVLTVHHLAAFINAYGLTLPGAGVDAVTFHQTAATRTAIEFTLASGSKNYVQLLTAVYAVLSPSQFLASELSVLANLAALLVLIKIVQRLGYRQFAVPCVLVFGLLPSMVILTSVPLREAFQVLFFIAATYWLIRYAQEMRIQAAILSIGCTFGMAAFHHGLSLLLPLYGLVLVVIAVRAGRTKGMGRMSGLAILALGLYAAMRNGDLWLVGNLLQIDPFAYIQDYRAEVAPGRTDYTLTVDFSSIAGSLWSLLAMFLAYMYSPLFQLPDTVVVADLYAVAEAAFRVILTLFAVRTILAADGEQRRLLLLLLAFFLAMEFLWALGTTNYGTAIRHRMVAYWILVVLATPALVTSLRSWIAGLQQGPGLRLAGRDRAGA